MPTPPNLQKAELREVRFVGRQVQPGDRNRTVQVQFNPETLTVTFSNQSAGGDQRGGAAVQYVGRGTTKLTLELWFDVTAPLSGGAGEPPDDVRKLTQRVAWFMYPQREEGEGRYVPPGVRFVWGTFLFDGVMDSLTERLEYFSAEGKPLRASVSIGLTAQEIQHQIRQVNDDGSEEARGLADYDRDGPFQQQIRADANTDWHREARERGVEDPLRPQEGRSPAAGAGRR